MAEPVIHDVPTNPCRQCPGAREVLECSWRDPRFSVNCTGCGNREVGADLGDAVSAWNAANADREVMAEDVYAAAVTQLQPQLTPEFLTTLKRVLTLAQGPVSEMAEQDAGLAPDAVVQWCEQVAALAPTVPVQAAAVHLVTGTHGGSVTP